ncbi:MAG TPA: DUF4922 domain-containing protein [Candidatus Methylomirabilis sp.]|nr:DUF4922 domain-containing protein [Candidatus Methylomirabilis sp.]
MPNGSDIDFVAQIGKFYQTSQEWLQKLLDGRPVSLGAKLELLAEYQAYNGFIQDDMTQVQRCKIPEDSTGDNPERVLFAQFNPRRSQRGKGAGRISAPDGIKPVNGNCFLCPENVAWQQCGLEFAYHFTVNKSEFNAMCNPFPMAHTHMTIAAAAHEPQQFIEMGSGRDLERVKRVISDLLSIISLAPDFIGFYNGLGAGASIPTHFHYQLFKRHFVEQSYPIELAVKQLIRNGHKTPFVVDSHNYPITFIYFSGRREEICNQVSRVVEKLLEGCGHSPNLSVNVVATIDHEQNQKEGSGANYYKLYLIPRDIDSSMSPGRKGVVGGLEVLGEIVFTEPSEQESYLQGHIDYRYVSRILRAVESRTVSDFLGRMAKTLIL